VLAAGKGGRRSPLTGSMSMKNHRDSSRGDRSGVVELDKPPDPGALRKQAFPPTLRLTALYLQPYGTAAHNKKARSKRTEPKE
jgi:hypothetical protein